MIHISVPGVVVAAVLIRRAVAIVFLCMKCEKIAMLIMFCSGTIAGAASVKVFLCLLHHLIHV